FVQRDTTVRRELLDGRGGGNHPIQQADRGRVGNPLLAQPPPAASSWPVIPAAPASQSLAAAIATSSSPTMPLTRFGAAARARSCTAASRQPRWSYGAGAKTRTRSSVPARSRDFGSHSA